VRNFVRQLRSDIPQLRNDAPQLRNDAPQLRIDVSHLRIDAPQVPKIVSQVPSIAPQLRNDDRQLQNGFALHQAATGSVKTADFQRTIRAFICSRGVFLLISHIQKFLFKKSRAVENKGYQIRNK
jgi:hypothetical protein